MPIGPSDSSSRASSAPGASRTIISAELSYDTTSRNHAIGTMAPSPARPPATFTTDRPTTRSGYGPGVRAGHLHLHDVADPDPEPLHGRGTEGDVAGALGLLAVDHRPGPRGVTLQVLEGHEPQELPAGAAIDPAALGHPGDLGRSLEQRPCLVRPGRRPRRCSPRRPRSRRSRPASRSGGRSWPPRRPPPPWRPRPAPAPPPRPAAAGWSGDRPAAGCPRRRRRWPADRPPPRPPPAPEPGERVARRLRVATRAGTTRHAMTAATTASQPRTSTVRSTRRPPATSARAARPIGVKADDNHAPSAATVAAPSATGRARSAAAPTSWPRDIPMARSVSVSDASRLA